MNRLAALLFAAVLAIGSVSALPAAAAATAPLTDVSSAIQAETGAAEVSPGHRLAGVVGAGQAEFEGEVELRAYGIAYAAANSNASKADVVADRLETVRERLGTLGQRRAALEQARENGSMGEGEYRARVTALAARSQQLQQLANASQVRAGELPDDVLAERGVNATAIRTLQAQAAELTGREVAEIARSIAGPSVGRSVSGGPPAGVGQPDEPDAVPEDPAQAGNTTDVPSNGSAGESGQERGEDR